MSGCCVVVSIIRDLHDLDRVEFVDGLWGAELSSVSTRLLAEPLLNPQTALTWTTFILWKKNCPAPWYSQQGLQTTLVFLGLWTFLSLWYPLKVSPFSVERLLEQDYQYIHKLPVLLFWDIKPRQDVLPRYVYRVVVFFFFSFFLTRSQKFSVTQLKMKWANFVFWDILRQMWIWGVWAHKFELK